jgi:hypothetical protein
MPDRGLSCAPYAARRCCWSGFEIGIRGWGCDISLTPVPSLQGGYLTGLLPAIERRNLFPLFPATTDSEFANAASLLSLCALETPQHRSPLRNGLCRFSSPHRGPRGLDRLWRPFGHQPKLRDRRWVQFFTGTLLAEAARIASLA